MMLEIISALLILVLTIYIGGVLYFYRGLFRLSAGTNTDQHAITVIIPARNESANIGACLRSILAQEYPKEKLSIIVVDDQSTDDTAEIVRRMATTSPFPLTVLRSDEGSPIRSPKMRAMMLGIQHSMSEIIVTTDADCIVRPGWIAALNSYFETNVGVVTGLTVYDLRSEGSRTFNGMQFIDFLSYTAIAAGAIGMGRVLVGNGSNMAFRVRAFDESGGFMSIAHINTGDDSLLAQQIARSGEWSARFAYDEQVEVTTRPVETVNNALHQRMRWVGQTAYYPAYMMFFMIATFVMFVLLAVMIPYSFIEWTVVPWIALLGKFVIDFVMMDSFTRLTRTHAVMRYYLPMAIVYIPYVLVVTIGGYFFPFTWKDRTMSKESA